MKLTKITTAIVISCALVGCFEVNRSTDQLCSNNPSLQCQRLNMGDGQCRVPRTDLVWHRYEGIKKPSIKNKIEEYELTAKYRNCLDLASQIRVISDDKLKRLRFEALKQHCRRPQTDRKIFGKIRITTSSLFFMEPDW